MIRILDEELFLTNLQASLIFDSSEQINDYAQSAKQKKIEVVYAPKGKTADEYIIELVEQNKSPKTLVVVTSDIDLQRQCQYLGAHHLSIEEFISFVIKKRKKGKPTGKPSYKESSQEMQRLIKIFEEKLRE